MKPLKTTKPNRPDAYVPHAPGHPERRGTGGGKNGTLRAAIFGVNDGLVSNLSLIMGVAAATTDPHLVVLAGVAGLLAGAFSMGAGEYISMRAQRDLFEQLLTLEKWELENEPEEELEELTQIYRSKGIPDDLAAEVATILTKDPEVALATHAREELGLDPEQLGSPWGAAASSFITFSFGAFIPLIVFLFGSAGNGAVVAAAILSGITLFAVGSLLSILTGKGFVRSGLRMLGVGAAAATITYAVGSMFHIQGI